MSPENSRVDLVARGGAAASGVVLRYGLVLIILWFGDLLLLGAAFWSLGESVQAMRVRAAVPSHVWPERTAALSGRAS